MAMTQHINGMPVIIHYGAPVMQVSPEFERIQHPDLVRKTNEWLLARFGRRPSYLVDDQVLCVHDRELHMNEVTWLKLQQALRSGKSRHPTMPWL